VRPLLLLDVDGVLNPYAGPCPPGYAEHALFPDQDEPVRVLAAHGEWIAELTAAFAVTWATSWGDQANVLLGPPLGLPRFPHVMLPPPPFPPAGKVPASDRHVADHPTAWVDDQLTPEAYGWAAARPAPTLLLPVNPAVGLTRVTVEEALDWAGRVVPPAAGTTPGPTGPRIPGEPGRGRHARRTAGADRR
jgi:hypothetical protein